MSDDGLLLRVLNVLETSLSATAEVQSKIQQELNELTKHQNFDYCLISVFSNSSYNSSVRYLAGLTLKNRLKTLENSSVYKTLIKQQCLLLLEDSSPDIRNSSGILITSLIHSEADLLEWPELMPHLNDTLVSNRFEYSAESVAMALQKIFEDHAQFLVGGSFADKNFNIIDCIFTNLIRLILHPNIKLRTSVMSALNNLIVYESPIVAKNLRVFLDTIFQISNSDQPTIIQQICRSIVSIAENRFDLLCNNTTAIIEYMLSNTQSTNYTVALEACEFWQIFANNSSVLKTLQPYLNKLVPILIDQMKYNDVDLAMLNFDIEQEDVADRLEDLKPVFHKSNAHDQHEQNNCYGEDDDDDNSCDENDIEDACEVDDYGYSWTLRKSASISLDILSESFQEEIVMFVMHKLNLLFNHSDWIVRESGILVLGAIAKGCYNYMASHLSNIFNLLLRCLNDEHILVRTITLWTISRYYKWFLTNDNDELLNMVLEQVCKKMLDPSKRVQEQACCCLSTLAEKLGVKMKLSANKIVSTFYEAAKKYKTKNWRVLCESIATFVLNVIAEEFHQNHMLVEQIMSVFMFHWNSVDDSHPNIIVLFDTIGAVVSICNTQSFAPFAQILVNRSLSIIDQFIVQTQLSWEDLGRLSPDQNFIICSMDLLGRIFERFQTESITFFHEKNLINLLMITIKIFDSEIRKYSYYLVGDISYNCFPMIAPSLNDICTLLIDEINLNEKPACTSNAIWALGSIIIQSGTSQPDSVGQSIIPLVNLINQQNVQNGLSNNCAIVIGYICLNYPELMTPYLSSFIKMWCVCMRDYKDCREKELTFIGVCRVIIMNCEPVLHDVVRFFDAIGSWFHPTDNLLNIFQQTIDLIRQKFMDDSKWQLFWQNIPQPLVTRLQQLFSSTTNPSILSNNPSLIPINLQHQ